MNKILLFSYIAAVIIITAVGSSVAFREGYEKGREEGYEAGFSAGIKEATTNWNEWR